MIFNKINSNLRLSYLSLKKKLSYKDYYQLKKLREFKNISAYHHLLDFTIKYNDHEQVQMQIKSLFPEGSLESLMNKFGKPLYSLKHNIEGDRIDVKFYKRIISGKKVKLEFHFYQNFLFYYSYSFPYLTKREKEEIKDSIIDKYDLDLDDLKTGTSVLDKERIFLRINDEPEFKLNYLDTKSRFYKKLKNYHHEIKDEKMERSNEIYNLI